MLYKYRYKNNKDYYQCSLNRIKIAFNKYIESIKCGENQIGCTIIKSHKITYYENKLQILNNIINLANIL